MNSENHHDEFEEAKLTEIRAKSVDIFF